MTETPRKRWWQSRGSEDLDTIVQIWKCVFEQRAKEAAEGAIFYVEQELEQGQFGLADGSSPQPKFRSPISCASPSSPRKSCRCASRR